MSTPDSSRSEDAASRIAGEAAAWISRRDRGLSADEQDAYLQWMGQDARHREAVARLEHTWSALDRLPEWRPARARTRNRDVLAPPLVRLRRGPRTVPFAVAALVLAAAAALVLLPGGFLQRDAKPADSSLRIVPEAPQRALADGSVLRANQEANYELAFTPTERRLRLVTGEVHVEVAKDPHRPFVIESEGVAARALGTAFSVRRDRDQVQVLVTEGTVGVVRAGDAAARDGEGALVRAGHRARIDLAQSDRPIAVDPIDAAQIAHALAWQRARLEFEGLPLAAVIVEFNRRNARPFVIADPRLAELRVSGSFGADQIDAFARLLAASFGLVIEHRADGAILLRKAD